MEENVTPQNTIPIRRPGASTAPQSAPEVPQYPTEIVPLPSKGWFYDESNPMSSGQIEVKMMTAKEEDILTNQNYAKKGIIFDKLIQSLVVDKNIDLDTIFVMDQNAIMIAIRRLAYGDSYKVRIECPKCGDFNDVDIDLSKFEEKDVDVSKFTKGINEFEFTLPKSQKHITYKILTQNDQQNIESEFKQLHKANKESSAEITIRLKYLLTSIDGNRDKIYIKNFISTMLAFDARALRDEMSKALPTLDTDFDFECLTCSHSERMDVPITAQFFWPDSGR